MCPHVPWRTLPDSAAHEDSPPRPLGSPPGQVGAYEAAWRTPETPMHSEMWGTVSGCDEQSE